jgi:hypothetical protein
MVLSTNLLSKVLISKRSLSLRSPILWPSEKFGSKYRKLVKSSRDENHDFVENALNLPIPIKSDAWGLEIKKNI